MSDTRGTFRLKQVRSNILNNEYVSLPSVWLSENQGVGYTKFYNQFQYKLNFSTNSATVTTHLPTSRVQSAGTSNATAAYFIAGEPGPVSDAVKITYASDTSDGTPSARFHIPINAVGALAGKDHSYLFGGFPSGSTYANKLTFANDTTVNSPSSYLEGARYNVQTGTAGGANGYMFAGGTAGYSITQKIAFANDTRSTLPSSSNMKSYNENAPYGNILPYWGAGKMQCSTHCYYAGGNPGGANFTSSFQKLTFSNETWAVNPSKMSRSLRYIGGFTASSTQGAIAGGSIPPHGSGSSSVDFVTFANDTWATSPSFTLPSTPGGTAGAYYNQVAATTIHDSMHSGTPGLPVDITRWIDGAAESPNYGYSIAGRAGQSPAYGDKAYKIDFSNDTPSASPSLDYYLTTQYSFGAGNQTQGYVMGGTDGSPSDGESRVMKVTYATETKSDLAGAMAVRRYGSFAMTDGGNTKMFVLGGRNPTVNTGRQMTLSNETWSNTPSDANLSYAKYRGASAATPTHGYAMMGSYDPGPEYRSHADKIEFSTYTSTHLPSVFPQVATGNSGLSESTAAYSMGGKKTSSDDMTIIQKLTFATDTGEALSQTLSSVRYWTQTMGKDTQGYVAGGAHYGPSNTEYHSFVDKFVYATSTISATPNLPDEQATGAGISAGSDNIPFYKAPTATPTASTYESLNPSLNVNAVFAAGRQQTSSTTYNRSKLTFSNDSMASIPSFTAYYNGYGNGSSTTRGYLTGGWGTNSMGDTQNTRWYNQYSNDASGAVSSIPYNAGGFFTVNSATELYAGGGGWSSGQYSSVHKMAFSNETNADVPGMKLTMQLKNCAGVGDKTVGYACGANYYNNWRSYISKITYATETIATSPATLAITGSSPYYGATGTSSKTKGYIMAGNATDRLTFSTDTISTLGAWSSGLSSAWPGTSANSATAGYTMLAQPSPHLIKFTFSNEGASTVPSVFSPARGRGGGMSSAMFGGAYAPAPYLI